MGPCNSHGSLHPTSQERDLLTSQLREHIIRKAVNEGNIASIRQLVRYIDVNMCLSSGETLLTFVIKQGRWALAELLLQQGANVDLSDDTGSKPLQVAILTANSAMVRLLLDHKADHSQVDISGLTPLQLACSKGLRHITDLLMRAGADPNDFSNNKERKTALLLASCDGQVECVEALCEGGADLDIKDMWGFTALSRATINQREGCVRALLEHGADANVANRSGATPLQYAALRNCCGILRLLITHGANVERFSRDIPPLSAVVLNGCAGCTGRLVAAGSDIHCLDKQRKMALYNAIVDAPKVEHLFRDYPLTHSDDRAACARILLDAGAEVGTVWRTQFWEPRHRNPRQVASYKLLLRASSLRRVPPTLAHGLFQKLALLGCTDAMRLMCSTGHLPSEQEIAQVTPWEAEDPCHCCIEAEDDDSKLCHKIGHPDFLNTLRYLRRSPAQLKHMARLKIRSHLHKNVIYHSSKLPLSDDLKNYVTVDGRNEYLPLIR